MIGKVIAGGCITLALIVALTDHQSKGPGIFDTGPPQRPVIGTLTTHSGTMLGIGVITTPAQPTTTITSATPGMTVTQSMEHFDSSPAGLTGISVCWWGYYHHTRSKPC